MLTMTNRVIVFTSSLLLLLVLTTDGQKLTIMLPTFTTSTLTVTTTTSTVCLSVDIAAGPVTPCRRRRQLWVENPILLILAPAEEQSSPLFIQPANTLRVEPTAVPLFRSAHFNSAFNGGAHLQPSFLVPVNDYMGFAPVPNYLYRKQPIEKRKWKSRKTTVAFTKTKTVTENEMTTQTQTVAISGCTPAPLPFDLCV